MDYATYTTDKDTNKPMKTATKRKAGRPKKDGLNTVTTVKIYEMLKDVLIPAGDKLFTFKEGYSDASIAKHFGVVEKTVVRHRVKLFGKLKFESEFIPYSVMLQRYNEIEKRLAYLESQLGVTVTK